MLPPGAAAGGCALLKAALRPYLDSHSSLLIIEDRHGHVMVLPDDDAGSAPDA